MNVLRHDSDFVEGHEPVWPFSSLSLSPSSSLFISSLESSRLGANTNQYNVTELPNLVELLKRYGISACAGAAVADSLLEDLDLATEETRICKSMLQNKMHRYVVE